MKQNARLIKLLRLVLLLLVFSLSAMTFTGGGTAEAAPQRITLSIEQWNQFKEQTNLLEAKLNLADEKLKQQKNTSTELLTQLNEEETAKSNARSADELKTLISECRGIIESQRSIIQEVDRANGIRTSGSKEN